MKKLDLLTIYGIVFVVIFMDSVIQTTLSMIYAVVFGVLLSFISYIHSSVQVDVVRTVECGEFYRSKVVRTYWEELY